MVIGKSPLMRKTWITMNKLTNSDFDNISYLLHHDATWFEQVCCALKSYWTLLIYNKISRTWVLCTVKTQPCFHSAIAWCCTARKHVIHVTSVGNWLDFHNQSSVWPNLLKTDFIVSLWAAILRKVWLQDGSTCTTCRWQLA